MNWNKAKTILIIFFICTNLFLLASILISADRTTIITDDIIASTKMILNNNRIEIDPEIIPRKTHSLSMIESENWILDYSEFSKKFVGEDSVAVENNCYIGEHGTISFVADSFSFSPSSSEEIKGVENLSSSNAEKIALEILKKYDFSSSNLFFEIDNSKDSDKEKSIIITKKKDNIHYFDSKIEITFLNNCLFNISGKWAFEKKELKENFALKNVTSVLIDYISLVNRPTTDEKIISIDLGYSILEEGIHHKKFLPHPCWRITLDNGAEYILNAVDAS